MKRNIHPQSHTAVFKDVASDYSFLTTTTLQSSESIEWSDGKTYPLIKVDVSSASHPFFTQTTRVMNMESRAEAFRKKYAGLKAHAQTAP